jgi:hypothetical protein
VKLRIPPSITLEREVIIAMRQNTITLSPFPIDLPRLRSGHLEQGANEGPSFGTRGQGEFSARTNVGNRNECKDANSDIERLNGEHCTELGGR